MPEPYNPNKHLMEEGYNPETFRQYQDEQPLWTPRGWGPNANERYAQTHSIDPETGALRGDPGLIPGELGLQYQQQHEQGVWRHQQELLGRSSALGASASQWAQGALGALQSFRPGGAAAMASGAYGQVANVELRRAGLEQQRAALTQPMDLLYDYRRHEAWKAQHEAKKASRIGGIVSGILGAGTTILGAATGNPAMVAGGVQQMAGGIQGATGGGAQAQQPSQPVRGGGGAQQAQMAPAPPGGAQAAQILGAPQTWQQQQGGPQGQTDGPGGGPQAQGGPQQAQEGMQGASPMGPWVDILLDQVRSSMISAAFEDPAFSWNSSAIDDQLFKRYKR
jgi:hypothetical protein